MVAAILTEARERAPRSPRTLFLGGGTPSLLSAEQLARVLDGLQEITGWRSSATEVTAECNPESLDESKALALLDLGVERLSIGFQSLDDETLALFGRVHTTADSLRAYDAARTAGVEHVNIDMIYAVPGQTAESWMTDLSRILDLEPDHLSAYNLTFEEDTRFKRWLDRGVLQKSDEDTELAMLAATRSQTADAGLRAYEISNHARTGEECAHNINYWRNGEYVGLGPGAVSKVANARAGNPRSIAPYVRAVAREGHATQWREDPTPEARLGETWWLGLRLAEGVEPADAMERAAFTGDDPTTGIVQELVEFGLLELDRANGNVRLTQRGLPLAAAR